MTDPSRYPDTGDDTGQETTSGGAPRWMVVLGICVAIVLLALVAVLHLTGVVGPK